jgi:hypothetical protein
MAVRAGRNRATAENPTATVGHRSSDLSKTITAQVTLSAGADGVITGRADGGNSITVSGVKIKSSGTRMFQLIATCVTIVPVEDCVVFIVSTVPA